MTGLTDGETLLNARGLDDKRLSASAQLHQPRRDEVEFVQETLRRVDQYVVADEDVVNHGRGHQGN